MKLALPLMLRRGCEAPPRLLQEEFRVINADVPVPGLFEEAIRHAAPGKYVQRGQLGRWKTNYTLEVSKRRFKHTGVTQVNDLRR